MTRIARTTFTATILLGLVAAAGADSGKTAGLAGRANQLYAAGRLDEAVATMAAAVAEAPSDAQLHFMHATALLRAGDHRAAGRAYERAADLRWEHPDTHLNLGFARYHDGRVQDARLAWSEAVRQAPADPMSRLALALGAWSCGDRAAALLEMDVAVALGDPATRLDPRAEVRWGRRGSRAIRRLLETWERTPASRGSHPNPEDTP